MIARQLGLNKPPYSNKQEDHFRRKKQADSYVPFFVKTFKLHVTIVQRVSCLTPVLILFASIIFSLLVFLGDGRGSDWVGVPQTTDH